MGIMTVARASHSITNTAAAAASHTICHAALFSPLKRDHSHKCGKERSGCDQREHRRRCEQDDQDDQRCEHQGGEGALKQHRYP
jgi:hypothetical protein